MKIRHLFVFTMVLALAALGTSCNKDSEKKFYGTWDLSQAQYRDSDNEDWSDTITTDGEKVSVEFQSDGTFTIYKDGVEAKSGLWSYKDDYLNFHDDTSNVAYKVDKCTKHNMEWFARREKWHDGELSYWREELLSWTK